MHAVFYKSYFFFLQIEQKNQALVYVEYTSMQKNTIPDIYSQLSVPDRNHLELPQNKFVPSATPNFWNYATTKGTNLFWISL